MQEHDFQLKEDELTGLQRLVLHHPATPGFVRARVGEASVSLIYADIDNLKTFQDYNGLPLGDALLKAVAMVLRSALPTGASAYRVGGDEFLAVLPACSLEQAIPVAEAILQSVRQIRLDAYGKWSAISPGITLGLAASNGSDWDALQLIQQADEANLKGKTTGKNKISY